MHDAPSRRSGNLTTNQVKKKSLQKWGRRLIKVRAVPKSHHRKYLSPQWIHHYKYLWHKLYNFHSSYVNASVRTRQVLVYRLKDNPVKCTYIPLFSVSAKHYILLTPLRLVLTPGTLNTVKTYINSVSTSIINERNAYLTTYWIQCCCLNLSFQLHIRFCRFSKLHKTRTIAWGKRVFPTSVEYTFLSRSQIPFQLSTSTMMIPKIYQWKRVRHNWQ